jgi:hypothetical protein
MGGIRIIKLDDIVKSYYKNYKCKFTFRLLDVSISNDLLMRNIVKYRYSRYKKISILLLYALFEIYISKYYAIQISTTIRDKQGMTCSEFVYKMLYKCGVVKPYNSSLIWPHHFSNGKFDKLCDFKYGKFMDIDNKTIKF